MPAGVEREPTGVGSGVPGLIARLPVVGALPRTLRQQEFSPWHAQTFPPPNRKGHNMFCKLGDWLQARDDDDRKAFEFFARPERNAVSVLNILREVGAPVGVTTVKEHMRGRCICG